MKRHLGKFVPSQYDVAVIASEMREWLLRRGIQPREVQIGVRTPVDTVRACRETPVLMEWHRDGAGTEPRDPKVTPSVRNIIVWSNGTPTELSIDSDFEPSPPFEVVMFDNVKVWHRSPPPEPNRWFVQIADPIEL